MKKKALFVCLLAVLLLLCACGRNDLLKKAGNNVRIYRWDGEKTVDYWNYEIKKGRPVVKALKAVPAKKAPDWTADLAETPLYGVSVDTSDGTGLKALWTGGYWIDEAGNAWTFDFDFEQLIADTEWHSVQEHAGIGVPCSRYAAQNGDSWNPAFLNPAEEPKAPAKVSMTLTAQTDEAVTVTLQNEGSAQWMYGEYWQLHVLLEDGWYNVPAIPGNWGFIDIGYLLQPGQTVEKTFRLDVMYGDLPAGQYRVVLSGLTAEFVQE